MDLDRQRTREEQTLFEALLFQGCSADRAARIAEEQAAAERAPDMSEPLPIERASA